MSVETLILGAVAYDPKVVTIWEGFKRWFEAHGLPFDFLLYSNYERQVEGQLGGQCHVAWSSPLAFLEAERAARATGRRASAIAMRDTDRNLTSVVVVRAGSPSGIETVAGLRGKVVAVGAADSPQATLLPLLHLAEAGLEADRDLEVRRFDRLVGKHGDHVGGEREAARALMEGTVDAACMIDGNHLAFAREGLLPSGATRVIATTAPYDHCCFTVLEGAPAELLERFRGLLLSMSYEDAEVRPLLDLEGLKAWLPGRTAGYAQLERAVERFGTLDPWLERMGVLRGAA